MITMTEWTEIGDNKDGTFNTVKEDSHWVGKEIDQHIRKLTLYDLSEVNWSSSEPDFVGLFEHNPVLTHQFWAEVEINNDHVFPMYICSINLTTGEVVYAKPKNYQKVKEYLDTPDKPITIAEFYKLLQIGEIELTEDSEIKYYKKYFKKANLKIYNDTMEEVIAEFDSECEHDWCGAVPNPYGIIECCDKCHDVKYK